jgi:hypothetical protein
LSIEDLLHGQVVFYPKAIPDHRWLVSRLLWADEVSALWPLGQPEPTRSEAATFKSLLRLEEAELFQPRWLHHENLAPLLEDLEEVQLIDQRRGRKFVKQALGQLPKGSGAQTRDPGASSRTSDLFLYVNKLPGAAEQRLERLGVLERREDGHFNVRSRQEAARLMSVAVNHSKDRRDRDIRMIPDAASDDALWQSAMPAREGTGTPATAVNFPLVTPLRDIEIKQLIEFRTKDSNDRLRRDYLAEVSRHVRKKGTSEDGDAVRAERALKKVEADMQLAATSFVKRFGRAGLTIGFTAAAALVPQAHELDNTAKVIGGAAQISAAAVGATRGLELRRPHKYLRIANRAELLPPF